MEGELKGMGKEVGSMKMEGKESEREWGRRWEGFEIDRKEKEEK